MWKLLKIIVSPEIQLPSIRSLKLRDPTREAGGGRESGLVNVSHAGWPGQEGSGNRKLLKVPFERNILCSPVSFKALPVPAAFPLLAITGGGADLLKEMVRKAGFPGPHSETFCWFTAQS